MSHSVCLLSHVNKEFQNQSVKILLPPLKKTTQCSFKLVFLFNKIYMIVLILSAQVMRFLNTSLRFILPHKNKGRSMRFNELCSNLEKRTFRHFNSDILMKKELLSLFQQDKLSTLFIGGLSIFIENCEQGSCFLFGNTHRC